jgi:hypothetical protein
MLSDHILALDSWRMGMWLVLGLMVFGGVVLLRRIRKK